MQDNELLAGLVILRALITDIRRVQRANVTATAAFCVALAAKDPTFEERFRLALKAVEQLDDEPHDPDLEQMMAVIEHGIAKIRAGEHRA
jgi:hypothetical protein